MVKLVADSVFLLELQATCSSVLILSLLHANLDVPSLGRTIAVDRLIEV